MPTALEETLRTSLRSLALGAARALENLTGSGLQLPLAPVPQLALDDEVRAYVDNDVEWDRLGRSAMDALDTVDGVFVAEAAVANALGVDGPEWRDGQRGWSPQGQIVDAFVADYLRRWLQHEDDTSLHAALKDPADAALTESLEHLARYLERSRVTGRVVAPLENFDSASDSVLLDSTTRIVRFDDEQKRELWRDHGWGGGSAMPLQLNEILDWHHAIEVDVLSKDLLAGPDWAAAQYVIDDVVSALRLTAPGAVRNRRQWLRLDPDIAAYARRLNAGAGLYGPPWWYGPVGWRYELKVDDQEELRATYERLRTHDDNHAFALARRRFDASYGRDDDEDRLVDHWIAFERLFVDDNKTELRYRASLRVARFLGDTAADRRGLFEALQKSYDWRSAIVHGSPPSDKTVRRLGTLAQTASETEDILRRVLARWLDPSHSNDLTVVDQQLLA